MGSYLNPQVDCRVVGGVADLAQGKGPTITQAADGTLQVLTNNNSGDEVQFQRDGTLTWVNGGNAPGIFSVSLWILSTENMGSLHEAWVHQQISTQTRDMLVGVQVGPKGVHVEKDNVFNSQAYAAGAPAITIGNDPSAASSSSSTAYSGAVAQAPSASTYQTNQNTAGSSNSAVNSGGAAQAPSASSIQNNQNTQSAYSATNQAASSTGSGAGTHMPMPSLLLSHIGDMSLLTHLDCMTDHRCPLLPVRTPDSHTMSAGTTAPAPAYVGAAAGNSNTYTNAVPPSSSDSQAQAPVPGPGEECWSRACDLYS